MLTLRSEQLSVDADPDRGGDITRIRWLATGTELLARWPPHEPPAVARGVGGDSRTNWLAGYRGGWQLLTPNGGESSLENDATWAYHGEASRRAWYLEEAGTAAATWSVDLRTAPLRIVRTVTLHGPSVRVVERVTNWAAVPTEVMYIHHPAFGAPLVGPDSRVHTTARSVALDDQAGSGSPEFAPWPHPASGMETTDLSTVVAPNAGRSLLAYLADFDEPLVALTNARAGVGVALRWSRNLPYAWLWHEAGGDRGFPWFGAAYILAIEPASTLPAHGMAAARAAGYEGLRLPAGGEVTVTVELTAFEMLQPIDGLDGIRTVLAAGRERL